MSGASGTLASAGGGLQSLFQAKPGLLMQPGSQLAGMTPGMIASDQSQTGGPLSPEQLGSLVQPSIAKRAQLPLLLGGQMAGEAGGGQSRGMQDIQMGLQALAMLALL